jgi:phosphoglycerate dehydrogenase-like enzyme
MPNVVAVAFELSASRRAILAEALGGGADIVSLAGLDAAARAETLRRAGAILANHTRELTADEVPLIAGAKLLQLMPAGVDHIPVKHLPPGVPVACNAGAYAEAMAEHAVAMACAAAKRLLVEHHKLKSGEFNQFVATKGLTGATCGILGLGGIGVSTARRMRALGLKVHAINRRGASDEPVDWIGTPDKLDALLAASDVLVLSLPLTRKSERLLGARELSLMKRDAILVNLARGEIIDEAALYAHLLANPGFVACLDAWWVEPVRHGRFEVGHPFLDLPNVIGSPHNSAAGGGRVTAMRLAGANCARAIRGEPPLNIIGPDERMR